MPRLHTVRVLLFVIAVSLLLPAGWMALDEWRFAASAEAVEAQVIGHRSQTRGPTRTTGRQALGGDRTDYWPVVAFRLPHGRVQTFESDISLRQPYGRGDRVRVLYSPNNPKVARVDAFVVRWRTPMICASIGALFLLTGLATFFVGAGKSDRSDAVDDAGGEWPFESW